MAAPNVKAGMILTAQTLADFGREGTWTPALTATTTNPTLGTGPTQVGDWLYKAGYYVVEFEIIFGTGPTAGSGNYRISTPFAIDAGWISHAVGTVRLFDSSGADPENRFLVVNDANNLRIEAQDGTQVTNAVPWTWAASDAIRGSFEMKAA